MSTNINLVNFCVCVTYILLLIIVYCNSICIACALVFVCLFVDAEQEGGMKLYIANVLTVLKASLTKLV